MDHEQAQNEKNAVQILAMAAESYLTTLDGLSKNFVTPQVTAAVQILQQIIEERNPGLTAVPAEDTENPAEAAAPAKAAKSRAR